MESQFLKLSTEILNYNLGGNFTIVQLLSFFIVFMLVFDFFNKKRLTYLAYMLIYFNVNRLFINMEVIKTDRGLLILNLYIILGLYLFWFFRKELLLLREDTASMSNKITDIMYGKLLVKIPLLNILFFFRNCLLFILDNLINLENVRKEKKKLFFLAIFSFLFINIFGAYEFLIFTFIFVFFSESEKKKYRANTVYKNNFDKNVFYFNTLANETKINKPIRYFFVTKATMFTTAGKAAADNPKAVTAVVVLAGMGVGLDSYITYDTNVKIFNENAINRAEYFEHRRSVTESNIESQKTYREALSSYTKNPKGMPPNPPTLNPVCAEPTYIPYKQTFFGASFSKITSNFTEKK